MKQNEIICNFVDSEIIVDEVMSWKYFFKL